MLQVVPVEWQHRFRQRAQSTPSRFRRGQLEAGHHSAAEDKDDSEDESFTLQHTLDSLAGSLKLRQTRPGPARQLEGPICETRPDSDSRPRSVHRSMGQLCPVLLSSLEEPRLSNLIPTIHSIHQHRMQCRTRVHEVRMAHFRFVAQHIMISENSSLSLQ
jgi:hypothetical protein